MNDLNSNQNLETFPNPLDTPPQGIEQEVVLPAAEVGDVIKKTPSKAKAPKPKQRVRPSISTTFLSEEDVRLMKRINKKMDDRFGISKNASFKV